MSEINKEQIVSYENLKTYILEKIQTNCCNIDRFPSDLPSDIDPHKTRRMSVSDDQSIEFQMIDSENVIKQVSSTTVKTQFESFLSQRGLSNKPNIPISSKAMLNLFNNITIFLADRTKIYTSMMDSKQDSNTYIFYDDKEMTTYPEDFPEEKKTIPEYDRAPFKFNTNSLGIKDSAGQVSKEEARGSVQSLISQINKTNKITAARLSIRCVCSSSSSCSSSSCSSSCCSSSSSSFIVYMLI